jgi:hypothetical protein
MAHRVVSADDAGVGASAEPVANCKPRRRKKRDQVCIVQTKRQQPHQTSRSALSRWTRPTLRRQGRQLGQSQRNRRTPDALEIEAEAMTAPVRIGQFMHTRCDWSGQSLGQPPEPNQA